jgi:DNA-binding CsgD family transcriptional regulator
MKPIRAPNADARAYAARDDRFEDAGSGLSAFADGWSEELPLSPRECEIARLVARGRTNKQIGTVLEISEWTVATHLRRMFAKLNVHSKAAMVARILDRVAAAERAAARSRVEWTDAAD